MIISDEKVRSLILPLGRKAEWEDCARQLAGMEDEVLRRFLPELMMWFQDLNWPGAEIIARRIEAFDQDILQASFRVAMDRAIMDNDDEWMENLKDVCKLGSGIWGYK